MTDQPPRRPSRPDFTVALDFTPVPSRTNRHDGWTEKAQRRFVAALLATGRVTSAARAVGKSVAAAYALRQRAGAESFVAAWEAALDQASDRAFEAVMERALHGVSSARSYRGRFTGVHHGYRVQDVEKVLRDPSPRSGRR